MIERIIDICLKNRLPVLVGFVLIALAGVWALQRTPVDAIPDIGENQVIVFANWSGRSPKDMEDQVIYPLSTKLLGIPDIKDIRSNSMFSFGYVNIIFKDNVDFYWARTRVLERMNLAMADMPEGVIPFLGPDATALGQILWYTVENGYYCPNHSDVRYADPGTCPIDGETLIPSRLDLYELRTLQDWYIRYYLEAADGVSEVATVGGYVKEYQIDVDPNKLLAYGASLHHVFNAVKKSNMDVGAKVIEEGGMEFLIRGLGFIESVEDIEDVVIHARDGVPVTLKDVGTVTIGPAFRRGTLDKDGLPAVGGVVLMRYRDNPLRVIKNVRAKVAELEVGLPPGVRIVPFYDRTALIERATNTLKNTLTNEVIIAVAVILFFLGYLSSSLIVSIVLPLGILMAFLGMKLLGMPSNIMSMGGIAIAVGVMVDAGIVMTENITRLLAEPHEGTSKLDVVVGAAKEVGPPIFFAMLIIIMAMVSVLSLTGQAGKLFRPLAFTNVFAMLSAAIVAVTLVPVLCALFLGDPTRRRRGVVAKIGTVLGIPLRPFRWLASGVTAVLKWAYGPIIRLAVRNLWTKLAVVVLCFGIVAASLPLSPLYKIIGQEFMPPLNEGDLLFMPILLPGASITTVKNVMARQDQIISRFPEVISSVGKLGRAETATDPAPIGMIETIISIKDPREWPRRRVRPEAAKELVVRLAKELDDGDLVEGSGPFSLNSEKADVIVRAVATRLDEMAVTYPLGSNTEGERTYRMWLLRLAMEEILRRWDARPVDEKALQELARVIEPTLDHERTFRKKARSELIKDLVEATRMPGVSPIMTQPIRNRVDMLSTGIQTPIGIKVFGKDIGTMEKIAVAIEKVLAGIDGALNPYAERTGNKPYIELEIDRMQAARYGISVGALQHVLMTAVGGMPITTTVEGRERFPVRVRYMRELRDNVEALRRILVPTPSGAQIPLEQVVRIIRRPGPAKISSENTMPFTRIFCDVDVDKIGLVDFVEKAQKELAEKIKPYLPTGYLYSFSGQYEAEIESRKTLSVVVPLCIVMIFLLLYIKFKSPAAILSVFCAVLFAFVGGMWLQYLMRYVSESLGGGTQIKYSTAVWVGYIALFGIAVEGGIVLIQFLMDLVQRGGEVDESAVTAGLLRVRPILMTTATTVLALLPIMIAEVSTHTGSEIMKPIAVPIFGGLVTSTVTNLVLAPVLFCLLWPLEKKIERLFSRS